MWLSPLKCLRFRLQNRRTGTFRSERHTTLYSTRNISQTPIWNAQKWMKKGNKKRKILQGRLIKERILELWVILVIQDTSVRLQEASPFVNKELYIIFLICPRNKLDARLLLPLFHRAKNCSSLVPLICMFDNNKSVFYESQWIFGTFIIVAPYFMTKGSQLPCYDVNLRNRS